MPVSQVTVECPCCGQEIELILVGAANPWDEVLEQKQKPKRRRRSKAQMTLDQPEPTDGDGPVRE